MPMPASWNKLRHRSDGSMAVEFALALPILMLLIVGPIEVGRAMHHAGALERSLRAGAVYAAHKVFPLTATTLDEVRNIVKTGKPQSGEPYLIEGWSHASASVDVQSLSYDLNGIPLPVIRVTANVPFDPLFQGLTNIFDAAVFTINLSHEQAYVGD